MINSFHALVAVVFCVAAAQVTAADDEQSAPARSLRNAAWFKQADKDGDGRLSREEAPNKDVFTDVDTDGDRYASVAELQVWLAKRPQRTGRPTPRSGESADPTGTELDDVEQRPVVIFSDGTRMAGDLYLPKSRRPAAKLPAIVLCAGTGGTKGGTQARVAPIFARNGFAVLAFDYRGWGESESQLMAIEPQPKPDAHNEMTIKVKALRWQMNYTDQTEDIRAAISFLAGEPNVDKNRIGLWGSSYGGGLVTTMAALDPRVKCVAAQVPGMGGRSPRAVAAAFDLQTKQARGETEPVPIETGKMTGKMERYSNMRVNAAKSVGFHAVELADRITAPIIFVVAENEELSNNDNVEAVHKGLTERGVPSAYHVIKGITHYGVYREGFEEAIQLELAWFTRHLKGQAEPATVMEKIPEPQPEPEPTTRPMGRGNGAATNPEAAFRYLDADQDGLLTEAELGKLKQTVATFRDNPQALAQFFQRLDADGDGKLTLDEYRKVSELRRQQQLMPGPGVPRRPESEAPRENPAPADGTSSRRGMSEAAGLTHFEKKIRPVLVAQCYSCHAADSKEVKGGLALDTREGIRKGGDSGPAVVPGDASASLLIAAIRHEDGLEMPPKAKLTDEQIADFVKWIDAGAFDPREGKSPVTAAGIDIEQGREFWAFQRPVKTPPPQVKDESWPLTNVDRFVRAAQEREGLDVVGDAEPRTLVRRLYFDLIGLPPTPEEVQAFVTGWKKNSAQTLESTVDRLLESRHFGERWGRHWLDVARYAESSGKETSFSYPQAWRYRDYVIDSFNADVPFDQFIREQIAGDLLPADNDTQRAGQFVATGFLALGPKSHIERNKKQFEMDLIDEQIDAVTQAFLGLTVACARCHDHKFDPIPQRDYYALAGIFRSTETLYGTIPVILNNNPSELLTLPSGTGMAPGVSAMTARERERLETQIADLRVKRREMARNKEFATSEFLRNGILLNTLEAKLKAYESGGAPKVLAMGVRDRATALDSELLIRGDIEKAGDVVPRGFVHVLCDSEMPELAAGSGRLELADWIASGDNPLTARVIVNRIWLNLFGRGLVTTPDNFGMSGQLPSHPELLDHLAVMFMDDGWSIKTLIRHLVLSRVYRLDSKFVAANGEKDPDNILLWRMSPRRLDAEAIRDAMLFTSGRLDLKPPVGSVVATGGEGYTGGIERGNQLSEYRFNSRSVYLPSIRGRAFESLDVFDGVDGSMVTGQRDQTTVPSQSLYLLNSSYVLGLASSAAQRLMREDTEPAARIDLAYQRWFGRLPTDTERNAALTFIDSYRQQPVAKASGSTNPDFTAWLTFCQSLWASGEFLVRK
ncbi:MAG: alpha/beta fold hydrolase [Pirellulaceae bacterium]